MPRRLEKLRGAPCVCSWTMPSAGSALPGCPCCCRHASLQDFAPFGRQGQPSLMFWPTSRNPATGGPPGGGAAAFALSPPRAPTPRHSPTGPACRPSSSAAGALMSGAPVGSLGTVGGRPLAHCAEKRRRPVSNHSREMPLRLPVSSDPGCNKPAYMPPARRSGGPAREANDATDLVLTGLGLGALLAGVPVRDHHSFAAEFDRERTITVTARCSGWSGPTARSPLRRGQDEAASSICGLRVGTTPTA